MGKTSSSPAETLLAENSDDAYFAMTLAKGLLVLEAFDIGATVRARSIIEPWAISIGAFGFAYYSLRDGLILSTKPGY